MIKLIVLILWPIATALWLPALAADEGDRLSLSTGGLLFGDFYYDPSNHLEAVEGAAGVVVR